MAELFTDEQLAHIEEIAHRIALSKLPRFLVADRVSSETPTSGQFLYYEGARGKWVPVTLSGATGSAHGPTEHTEFSNWKVIYTDGSGDQVELALGADDTVLKSTGAGTAPEMATVKATEIDGTANRVVYLDASGDMVEAAFGADGTVLTGAGTGTPPLWEAATEHESGHTDAAADGTTKGLATFEADDFDSAAGKIDLADDVVKDVTGDSGTATPAAHNVNVLGGTGITTTGASPTADDLTVAVNDDVVTDVTGDSGTVTPASNNVNILGGQDITTTGASPTADDITVGHTAGLRTHAQIESHLQYYNGTILESFRLAVTSDGATITGTLDKNPTGDLTEVFSDGYSTFTSGGTVTITAGTATAPAKRYIYILQSAKGTLAEGAAWPATEHIKIAEVIVQTAALVNSSGVLANRNWNNHSDGGSNDTPPNQGHFDHVWHRLRWEHSAYVSGGAVTWTDGATIRLQVAASEIFQMHPHTTDAFDTNNGAPTGEVVVPNHPTAYTRTADIETLLTDSASGSLTNKYYNLIVWGSISSGSETEQIFVNLPNGSYTKRGDAEADVSGYDVFTMPSDYKGYSYLIQRATIRNQTDSTWTVESTVDLRGTIPGITVGGGTSTLTTEFADSTFRVFDDGDPTKEIALQASGITTATTRTITMPDADVTLLSTATDGEHSISGTDIVGTAASVTQVGHAELATAAEMATGTDTGRVPSVSVMPVIIQDSKYVYAADAEASDAYVISLTPNLAGYVTGQVFHFMANTANTGAATLNVDGQGAITIKKHHDVDLEDGDIEATQIVTVVYDGTNFQMQSQLGNSPGAGAHGSGDWDAHGDITLTSEARGDIVRRGATVWENYDVAAVGAGAIVTTDGTDVIAKVAKRTILLTAAGGAPTTTSPCSDPTKVEFGTNDVDVWVLDFGEAREYAFWQFVWPGNIAGATAVTAKFYFTSVTAGGNVIWGIQGVNLSDTEAMDTAYGTAQEVTYTTVNQNDLNVTSATASSFMSSNPAGGDLVQIRAYRDGADVSDTHSGDARLLAIKLVYTTNDASDE